MWYDVGIGWEKGFRSSSSDRKDKDRLPPKWYKIRHGMRVFEKRGQGGASAISMG